MRENLQGVVTGTLVDGPRERGRDTVMVCANRRYRILQTELARAGMAKSAPKALALTDLTRPAIDWGGHWSEDSVCRLAG
jgi:hypothetical protein